MLYQVLSAYSLSLLMLWTVTVLHLCSVYLVVGALHDDEMVMMMMMMMTMVMVVQSCPWVYFV